MSLDDPYCHVVKSIGEPYEGKLHVRFDGEEMVWPW